MQFPRKHHRVIRTSATSKTNPKPQTLAPPSPVLQAVGRPKKVKKQPSHALQKPWKAQPKSQKAQPKSQKAQQESQEAHQEPPQAFL